MRMEPSHRVARLTITTIFLICPDPPPIPLVRQLHFYMIPLPSTFLPYRAKLLMLMAAFPFLGGCAHINITQIAYEMLRQEDCKMNQLEDFCTRTFASEYLEYERARQEFLRNQTQRTWRVNRDETKLSSNANYF